MNSKKNKKINIYVYLNTNNDISFSVSIMEVTRAAASARVRAYLSTCIKGSILYVAFYFGLTKVCICECKIKIFKSDINFLLSI